MRVELVDPEATLLAEIADTRMKRADIAATYALAMRSGEDIDWPAVNAAIIERWSVAGLQYVKTEAWRRVEGVGSGI